MYANGEGIEQNYETFFKWYTLAAEQGLANSLSNSFVSR